MCPISGMSTLQGVCPFAKPRGRGSAAEKPKLRLQLEFSWESAGHQVTVGVRPHLTEHWQAMGLPDSASKDEIRQRYKRLALEHHPDKHPDDLEAARERFDKISEAYQMLKDIDGELAFPWEEHPQRQTVMEPAEAIRVFAKVGKEACEQNPLPAVQVRNLVKEAKEIKALVFHRESEGRAGPVLECWLDATCSDHLIRVYRRDADGEGEPGEGEPEEGEPEDAGAEEEAVAA